MKNCLKNEIKMINIRMIIIAEIEKPLRGFSTYFVDRSNCFSTSKLVEIIDD